MPGDRGGPSERALPGDASGRWRSARAKELAHGRRRFDYRGLHVLLRREGQVVHKKRVQRIYREERLTVRRRGGRLWGRRTFQSHRPIALGRDSARRIDGPARGFIRSTNKSPYSADHKGARRLSLWPNWRNATDSPNGRQQLRPPRT